jgi:hypothetical protein
MNNQASVNQAKWLIFFKIVPLTVGFCLLKVLTHHMKWEIGSFDALTGSMLAAVTFTLAFLLTGTLNDYRISKDMPDQLSNSANSIQDTNLMIANRHTDYNPAPLTESLAEILQAVLLWLEQGKPFERVENTITLLNESLVPLSKYAEPPLMSRVQAEQANMRNIVTRIKVIRDTDFLTPAYTLLYILLAAATISLLTVGTKDFNANLLISGFLFASFSYLVMLIHDLDNPFEFDGKSCADVDLSPLKRTYNRLPSMIELFAKKGSPDIMGKNVQ